MIAIIYNASIKDLFYKYAVALKSEFDKLKVTSTIYTNQDIYNMQGLYNFKVAVSVFICIYINILYYYLKILSS